MNIKTSIKYFLNDYKKAILIFYIVLIAILLLAAGSITLTMSSGGHTSGESNGMELVTTIFLFICGLVYFKENFGFLIQNGVTRKTIFSGRIISSVCIGVIMAAADKIFSLIGQLLMSTGSGFTYKTFLELIYSERYAADANRLRIYFEGFIFCIFLYISILLFAQGISALFYRMNKNGKIIVFAGVPVLLTLLLQLLDNIGFRDVLSRIMDKLFYFIIKSFGFYDSNPYYAVITFSVIAIISVALNWLAIRRATIKN